ncbi:MAG: GAP family protein, partial [Streptosporangiaceae bacterium]
GLRLALGIAALVAAAVIWRRRPGPVSEPASDPASAPGSASAPPPSPERNVGKQKKPGVVARMTAEPRPATAFVVGVFVFGPSVSFLAAVQVVATAKASLLATVVAMAMIIVLTVLFAWLPLVAYLVAPDRTVRVLHGFNGWLRRNRRPVLTSAVAVIGVILTVQGLSGLLS